MYTDSLGLLSCIDRTATLSLNEIMHADEISNKIENDTVQPKSDSNSKALTSSEKEVNYVDEYFERYVEGREEWVDPSEMKDFYEKHVLRNQHGLYAVQQSSRLDAQYQLASIIVSNSSYLKYYKQRIRKYKVLLSFQFYFKYVPVPTIVDLCFSVYTTFFDTSIRIYVRNSKNERRCH